ncbi:MAG: DUF1648 domain-containing protein [Saprospiraceae bacterium]|nr:DUF1648 domain-containing protein [Saprospiraceae bacterium]
MEKRPVLHLPPTFMEIVVALTAVATLILSWILAALYYRDLPDTIVTHYNFSGLADGYGSKKMIFVMPGIATVIAIILALLSRIPHRFNYLVTITEANAESQYRQGRMILLVIGLLVALLAVWAVCALA